MRKVRVFLSILCVAAVFVSVAAPNALAYTKSQAETAAENYALSHFKEPYPSIQGCTASGKNEKGHAQWYCWGSFYNGTGNEWKVNVGPYGEITYAKE